MMDGAMPMMAMANGAQAPSPAPAPEGGSAATSPAVRKYFPETWIWDCVNSGFVSIAIPLTLCVLLSVCYVIICWHLANLILKNFIVS